MTASFFVELDRVELPMVDDAKPGAPGRCRTRPAEKELAINGVPAPPAYVFADPIAASSMRSMASSRRKWDLLAATKPENLPSLLIDGQAVLLIAAEEQRRRAVPAF
jgi:hypothetical protein